MSSLWFGARNYGTAGSVFWPIDRQYMCPMAKNKAYSGTRVRFQRVQDARFFGGWTVWFDGSHIVVKVGLEHRIEVGELFYFQAYGVDKCALFPAECSACDQGQVTFKVLKRAREVLNSEQVRLTNPSVTCTVCGEMGGQYLEVIDISPDGIGVAAPFNLAKGECIDVSLETPNGVVAAKATVQNCRATGSGYGYRIGLSLKIADRSMQGRWRNLFFEVA